MSPFWLIVEQSHVFNLRAIEDDRNKILAYDRQQSQLRGNSKQIEISIIHSQDDFFNSIQDGPFWGCSWMGRRIKITPPHINLSHIFYNDETWQNNTLPKEDPKNIQITWHAPWTLLTSAFFHRKLANFAISRNIDVQCILIHNFLFF